MRLIKWFMLAALVWFVPTIASAQVCETRGRLEACSQFAADGSRFYIVTPKRGALYGELLAFVNEGVEARLQITAQQIDDANTARVIYYCPGTDLCTRGICRNGVSQVVNGDSEPRRFETVCEGSRAIPSRGLVAGVAYRVPAHRALTSTEVVADATSALENNMQPLSGDVSRALAIGIEAGSDPIHAPSTLALVGLMQAARNAQGRLATVAPVAAAPSQTDEAPAPVVASASAEAAAQIVRLESDLALARVESKQRLIALIIALGLLVLMALALIWQHSDQKRAAPPDPNLRKEWGQRIANAEGERDDAKRELAMVAALFKSVVKAGPYSLEALKTFLGKATEFLTLWSAPLANLTPALLRVERGEALQFRTMNEAWTTTPTLNLPFSIESLEQVIADWMRLPDLEASRDLLKVQRDGFEQERAKPSSDGVLLERLDTEVRDKLTAIWYGSFGKILSYSDEEHRRVVDAKLVQELFSVKRTIVSGRGQARRDVTLYELQGTPLMDLFRVVHDGFGHALDTIDRMLGRKPEKAPSDEGDAGEQPLAREPTQIVANPFTKARDDEPTTRVATHSATAAGEPTDD